MTNKAWQNDIEDLIKYLGKYVEDEAGRWRMESSEMRPGIPEAYEIAGWIREGIEAFESINEVSVCVMPALSEAPAEKDSEFLSLKQDLPIWPGDDVEVRDLEGNTTVVAASEVLQVERVLGNDGSMHERVQVEDGGIVWYSAEHYQLIRV